MRHAALAILTALALATALPAPGSATSFVMVPDEALVEQATLVVEGTVSAVESAPSSRPATDYQVEVDRFLKGTAGGTTLIVRVPGGVRADGLRLDVFGAPRLRVGERAILFLGPGQEGTWRSLHLMLGTFPLVEAQARSLAVRRLDDTTEYRADGTRVEGTTERVRDAARFRSWIEARAAGRAAEADYFVDDLHPAAVTARFTQLDFDGVPTRWFEFDGGGGIDWKVDAAGHASLPSGGVSEFRVGLDLWTNEPKTPIKYRYAGTGPTGRGFDADDGVNMIHFEDPRGDIGDTFSCSSGGVLAIGGPWALTNNTGTFNGTTFIKILEADIVMAKGLDCFFGRAPDAGDGSNSGAEEVMAHELGHTLGMGHSCGDGDSGTCNTSLKRDALMRATAHNDGRGAYLGADDLDGIRFLYETAGGGNPPGPFAPGQVKATWANGVVTLIWRDDANDEDGFRVYRGLQGASLAPIAELPPDTESYLDATAVPGTTYVYQVGAFNDEGENVGKKVTVETGPAVPVEVSVAAVGGAPTTGTETAFRATVSGPVVRTEWSFGPTGRGFVADTCDPSVYCASHVFVAPGAATVTVTAVGSAGQTATASLPIAVNGPAVDVAGSRTFVQSVLFAPRGAASTYQSDLWIHNLGDDTALVEATFVPRGAGDPSAPVRLLTIPAGQSVAVPNLVWTLFALERSQGAVAIEGMELGGGPAALRAVSRSYVNLPDPAAGSFGQLVGEDPEATWSAAPKAVTGVLEGDGFVATLLAANLDDGLAIVSMELVDADGVAVPGTASFPLDGRSMRFQRLAALFPAAAGRPQPFTVRFTSNGKRFLASATLLETGSEDQIYIPAREPASAETFVVPRVVRSRGQFDTFLVSRLVALNNAPEATDLTIELWERGQDNTTPPTVVRTIPAGGMLYVEDVLLELFGLTDENLAGALRIRWENASDIAPRVLSYAFAQSPSGGRFGMLVDSRTIDEGAVATVDLPASQNDLFKASYGVINLGGTGTAVRVRLRRGDGSQVAQADLVLKPRQHLERNLLGVFPGLADGSDWSLDTEVLGPGEVLTYVANINASGDVFFVPGRAK